MSPKRTLSLLVLWSLLFLLAAAPRALAAGPHAQPAPTAKPAAPSARVKSYKLDDELTVLASARVDRRQTTSVIVELVWGAKLPNEFKRYERADRSLNLINGQVVDLPSNLLTSMAAHPSVFRVHHNRGVRLTNYRTAMTVGARAVQETMGLDGAGVGVAVIDSGVTAWHDDLTTGGARGGQFPYGNQRVAKFVDFVNGQALPYDDHGHGSHVSGIIAGNGEDSSGQKAGMAPNASLVSLKVLDANGQGTIGDVIAAMDWVSRHAQAYNIRVVNLSAGAPIHESYWTDPLTLAAKRLVEQGIVVVAAAGNLGKSPEGEPQWGGITAPGNAPWVLTVGASSTMGTLTRADDTMAAFSSRGPTYIDYAAKPDLVAPGVGTVSLASAGSTMYQSMPSYLVDGSVPTPSKPYLTLTGTSMAAPVVAGTVALMFQANPSLTPNLVKGILQYTAQVYPGYTPLEEGAGFLNTLGAVRLATFYAGAREGDKVPIASKWSRQILWGSHRLSGGVIVPGKSAWGLNNIWGTATDVSGQNIIWGTACGSADCGDNIIWGTSGGDNIIWGTDCGGADCDNVVWGASDGDNIIWGTASAGDNIIWGTSGGDNIIWGTSAGDNIIWGTADSTGEPGPMFPEDEASQSVPDLLLELGDVVPLVPGGAY